jgi:hypothetical protein
MGILKGGILGPIVNKVGNASGRMHRDTNVISTLPRPSNEPPSTAQKEKREKFGLLSSFLSQIDDLIKTGFKQYSKGKDPVNVAYSYNYNHAFIVNEAGIHLNYPAIKYSRGYIVEPESPTLLPLTDQVEFNWLPQRQSNYCQYTDLATFLVYNPAKEIAIRQVAATDRYEQGHLLTIPKNWADDTVHCYMNFSTKDGKLQGNSIYVGELACI